MSAKPRHHSQALPSDFVRLKERYKRFYARVTRYERTCDRLGIPHHKRRIPSLPSDLHGLTCGARTKRTGAPCKSKALYRSGRCKLHGGMSTGPTSEAGKAMSAANGKKGGRPRKSGGMAGSRSVKDPNDLPRLSSVEPKPLGG